MPSDIIHVERFGGLAGFGGSATRLRSRGALSLASLPEPERRAIEELFNTGGTSAAGDTRDGFRYRITRNTAEGAETVEANAAAVPPSLHRCVKDELA
jgi:hypothetical protein